MPLSVQAVSNLLSHTRVSRGCNCVDAGEIKTRELKYFCPVEKIGLKQPKITRVQANLEENRLYSL